MRLFIAMAFLIVLFGGITIGMLIEIKLTKLEDTRKTEMKNYSRRSMK